MSEWSYTSTHPLSTHGMEINWERDASSHHAA
jgi:hypothetical protein